MNGWGVYKIKNGLQLKGISSSIINEQLQTLDKDSSKDRLELMIKKRIGSLKESDPYKLKAKLIRYALGLGYEYESVVSSVEKQIKDNDFI